MIRYIYCKDQILDELLISKVDGIIGELSTLNVFAGKNNAGKSRLLRKLFYSAHINSLDVFFIDDRNSNIQNNQIFNLIQRLFTGKINTLNHQPDFALKEEVNNLFKYVVEYKLENEIKIVKFINELKNDDINFPEIYKNALESTGLITFCKSRLNEFESILQQLFKNNVNINTLYIPILRGLRPIQYQNGSNILFSNEDSFARRTKFDYFDNKFSGDIFTGLSIYEDIKKLLLGTEYDRKLIGDFEKFLSENIFENKVTLIPKYDKDVLHIKIGDNPQLEIYNLGDGLQTIISILFPIFIGKDNSRLVFIEEPESHLHPDWQSKLLLALKKIPNQQYLITTHSNAFINDSNTKLFSVKLDNGEVRINEANLEGDKLSIIRELGYKPSDLLQANYILWVEGFSDKIYIEKWINMIDSTLEEGLHYSILFFGGSNFKHLLQNENVEDLTFVKSINQNFGIILDSDRKKKNEKLREDKQKIKDHFDSNNLFCWITTYREIENYIDVFEFEDAIKKFHKKENITLATGEYDDRNKVIDNDAKLEFKSSIKLPESIFSKVQRNKDGTTKGVDEQTLRDAIDLAIKSTASNHFTVDKIKVAKEYVNSNPKMPGGELLIQLKKLIVEIKKANRIDE